MNRQICCKGCDLVIVIDEAELPIEAQAVVRLRCPYCNYVGKYTAADLISDSSPRLQSLKPRNEAAKRNGKVVCVLSWVPQLAQTRKWLLSANGYIVVSLMGVDGIRQLDGIEQADLFVLAHSVPVEQKQRAIKLFKASCGSPVLSLLPPHGTKLPEADYGVEALNPDEFVAAVNQILADRRTATP